MNYDIFITMHVPCPDWNKPTVSFHFCFITSNPPDYFIIYITYFTKHNPPVNSRNCRVHYEPQLTHRSISTATSSRVLLVDRLRCHRKGFAFCSERLLYKTSRRHSLFHNLIIIHRCLPISDHTCQYLLQHVCFYQSISAFTCWYLAIYFSSYYSVTMGARRFIVYREK